MAKCSLYVSYWHVATRLSPILFWFLVLSSFGSSCVVLICFWSFFTSRVSFISVNSKLSAVAKAVLKMGKQEMAEIENCPDCYKNAYSDDVNWFIQVCVSRNTRKKTLSV